MFGRKLNRIIELDSMLRAATDILNEQDKQINKLVGQLREMDQLAYKASQCTDWNQMRPHVQEIIRLAASRQKAESNRISDLMVREIKTAYTSPADESRLIDQPPSRLLK